MYDGSSVFGSFKTPLTLKQWLQGSQVRGRGIKVDLKNTLSVKPTLQQLRSQYSVVSLGGHLSAISLPTST